MLLKEGDKAPRFDSTAVGADGARPVTLDDFAGRTLVLYFYPKDDTPGCTKEACSFRDMSAEFAAVNAVILGVSPDSAASHGKFIGKFQLPFPLMADEDKAIATAYGVWKEKSMYGQTYMGVERTTFVIDAKGVIRRIFPKVKVEGHVAEVLKSIAEL